MIGKESSVTIVNEAGDEEKQSLVVHRDDFWASTSNKQLNFLQHVFTILKQHGRAASAVPDQRPFRRRYRRDSKTRPTQTSRRSHVTTSANRYLLRPRRQGQRPLLRPQTRRRETLDREALDLRPAHQQTLHAKRKSTKAHRPRRLCRLVQSKEPPRAQRIRSLQKLHLRRAN